MKNHKGVSLVELLVSLIVAAVMILMIGVISSIGNRGHKKVQNTESIYNDMSYGFKRVENKIRSSTGMTVVTSPTNPPWIASQLLMTNRVTVGSVVTSVQSAFGLYQASGSAKKAVVYVPDTSASGTYETILSVAAATDTLNVNFTNVTAKSVTIQISGVKNGIPFDASNVVLRRNP